MDEVGETSESTEFEQAVDAYAKSVEAATEIADDYYGQDEDIYNYLSADGGVYHFSIEEDKLIVDVPVKTLKAFPKMKVHEYEVMLDVSNAAGKTIHDFKEAEVNLKLDNPEVIDSIMLSKVGDVNTIRFSRFMSPEDEVLVEQIEEFGIYFGMVLLKK